MGAIPCPRASVTHTLSSTSCWCVPPHPCLPHACIGRHTSGAPVCLRGTPHPCLLNYIRTGVALSARLPLASLSVSATGALQCTVLCRSMPLLLQVTPTRDECGSMDRETRPVELALYDTHSVLHHSTVWAPRNCSDAAKRSLIKSDHFKIAYAHKC